MAHNYSTVGYGNVTISGAVGAVGSTATWITTSPFYTSTNIGIGNGNLTGKVRLTEQDIEIGGLSLKEFISVMQERMAILVPNPKLEKEFEELRRLREQYVELEKKLTEQARMWEVLKKSNDIQGDRS